MNFYRQGDNWPPRLLMQLIPKQLFGGIGQQYLKESRSVAFHPTPCESLESLTKVMSSGFVCIFFIVTQLINMSNQRITRLQNWLILLIVVGVFITRPAVYTLIKTMAHVIFECWYYFIRLIRRLTWVSYQTTKMLLSIDCAKWSLRSRLLAVKVNRAFSRRPHKKVAALVEVHHPVHRWIWIRHHNRPWIQRPPVHNKLRFRFVFPSFDSTNVARIRMEGFLWCKSISLVY